jgi:hypothetical protein
MDQMRGGMVPEPPPGSVPVVALAVLTDTATLRLVELSAGASVDGGSVRFRAQLANPNGAVTIDPPPPNLVDQLPGAGGILDGVGSEIEGQATPAPMAP